MSKQNRKRKQMVKEYKIGDSNKPILYTYFSNLCGLGLEYSAERFLVDYEGLHKGDAITPFLNYTCWPLPVRYDGENFPIAFTFFSNGNDPRHGSSIVGETLSSGFTQKPEGHGQKVFK